MTRCVVPSLIVTSKRKGGTPAPGGYTVIDVDRSHPILGNRHILSNHKNYQERLDCIEAYKKDLEEDFAVKGPMFKVVRKLARRVSEGEYIALRCWCAPLACHADVIRDKILELADC